MKYKAIIFDLDGVICNTDEYHYKAWKQVAEERNIYFDREINNRLRGVSRMESLEIILEKSEKEYSESEKLGIAEEKNSIYVQLLRGMTEADLSAEVRETLEALRQKSLKLAIGSSSKNTKMILQQLGLRDFFDAISDGTNITKSKPDPEVFLKAATMIQEQPEHCLVVEDALAGAEAAKRGGFDCAGIGDASKAEWVNYPLTRFKDLLHLEARHESEEQAILSE